MRIGRERIAAHAALAELVAVESGLWPSEMRVDRPLADLGLKAIQIVGMALTAQKRFGGKMGPWVTVGDAIEDLVRQMPHAPAYIGEPIASDMIQSLAGYFGRHRETGAHMHPTDVAVLEANLELMAEMVRSLEASRTWFLAECRRVQERLLRVTEPKVVEAAEDTTKTVTIAHNGSQVVFRENPGYVISSTAMAVALIVAEHGSRLNTVPPADKMRIDLEDGRHLYLGDTSLRLVEPHRPVRFMSATDVLNYLQSGGRAP